MHRDLIELPDTYTREVKFFNDPADLEQIFVRQEESNLFCIHRLQEAEENLESELRRMRHLSETKGVEVVELQKKHKSVERDIAESREDFEK